MDEERIFFRRKLPHYQPAGASFFITFRLTGSLPAKVVEKLKEERIRELKAVGQDRILSYRIQKKYFGKFDEYLDRVNHGQAWLEQGEIAQVVSEALHYWNGKRYNLLCYCIMPNHVHLVIETINDNVGQVINLPYDAKSVGQVGKLSYDAKSAGQGQVGNLSYLLSPILHSIKRYTAREANKILNRTGEFWQHESYDHVVRATDELERIVWYVVHNPVKAGLVKKWNEWKWTFICQELIGDVLE